MPFRESLISHGRDACPWPRGRGLRKGGRCGSDRGMRCCRCSYLGRCWRQGACGCRCTARDVRANLVTGRARSRSSRLVVSSTGLREVDDQGTIVIKRPDVWGEGKLTRFRQEFEKQIAAEAGNFHQVISGQVASSDLAAAESATAVGMVSAKRCPAGASGYPTGFVR